MSYLLQVFHSNENPIFIHFNALHWECEKSERFERWIRNYNFLNAPGAGFSSEKKLKSLIESVVWLAYLKEPQKDCGVYASVLVNSITSKPAVAVLAMSNVPHIFWMYLSLAINVLHASSFHFSLVSFVQLKPKHNSKLLSLKHIECGSVRCSSSIYLFILLRLLYCWVGNQCAKNKRANGLVGWYVRFHEYFNDIFEYEWKQIKYRP